MPNFNFLAQFEGKGVGHARDKLKKLGKPTKATFFVVVRRCNGFEKSKLPKGTSRSLEFQLPSSVWRGVMRGTNPKHKINTFLRRKKAQ